MMKMDCNEAIKILKKISKDLKGIFDERAIADTLLALDLAIKALEKQVVKKTKRMIFKALDAETREVVMYYERSPCPSCEKGISKIYKYYPHCGQRIEED